MDNLYIFIVSLSEWETQFIIAQRLNHCFPKEITEKNKHYKTINFRIDKIFENKVQKVSYELWKGNNRNLISSHNSPFFFYNSQRNYEKINDSRTYEFA